MPPARPSLPPTWRASLWLEPNPTVLSSMVRAWVTTREAIGERIEPCASLRLGSPNTMPTASNNIRTYQAITTRHLAPTGHRGPRTVAKACGGARLVAPYDYSLDATENMAAAAMALATRLGWSGDWVAASLNERDCVFSLVVPPAFTVAAKAEG